jgi:hypothetical protein
MTTGIQCKANPRCKEPAPPDTGICHCHAKQVSRAPAIHSLIRADQGRRAWSRELEKELEA